MFVWCWSMQRAKWEERTWIDHCCSKTLKDGITLARCGNGKHVQMMATTTALNAPHVPLTLGSKSHCSRCRRSALIISKCKSTMRASLPIRLIILPVSGGQMGFFKGAAVGSILKRYINPNFLV